MQQGANRAGSTTEQVGDLGFRLPVLDPEHHDCPLPCGECIKSCLEVQPLGGIRPISAGWSFFGHRDEVLAAVLSKPAHTSVHDTATQICAWLIDRTEPTVETSKGVLDHVLCDRCRSRHSSSQPNQIPELGLVDLFKRTHLHGGSGSLTAGGTADNPCSTSGETSDSIPNRRSNPPVPCILIRSNSARHSWQHQGLLVCVQGVST